MNTAVTVFALIGFATAWVAVVFGIAWIINWVSTVNRELRWLRGDIAGAERGVNDLEVRVQSLEAQEKGGAK